MTRGDVSFTFLDRVGEIELNIRDERWQSALALALTLPDICGGIAFPDLVRRYRDGRVMLDKQKNPSRDVGSQYIRWFDEYAGEFFKIQMDDEEPYICGERCWQLRCEYLHQNKGFLNTDEESAVRFHLGVHCGSSVCQLDPPEIQKEAADIRIDIEQFCRRMCMAARSYYEAVYREKDFSLYNTPVLDFVQIRRESVKDPLIVILCGNASYGNGLSQVLRNISSRIFLFSAPRAMRKKLGKQKPAVWIVTESVLRETGQSWLEDKAASVILLSGRSGKDTSMKTGIAAAKILPMPLRPEALRAAVLEIL